MTKWTVLEKAWRELIRSLGCVVCRRVISSGERRIEVHHVAEGSGVRSNFALAPLCHEHHEGGSGLHGMGERAFCALYRPPGDREWGLLIWMLEDLAGFLKGKFSWT